ncbi:MAG: secretin N-terminal domain-containing protein [Candidatus Omnitrophota bacterium]|nr:secretin N-terminal domain-containing protein [Candidatus Omnitrophota bacterium]
MPWIQQLAFKKVGILLILFSLFAACLQQESFSLTTTSLGRQGKETANPALISLEVKELDLKDALKIIAQASGMNIILDKDVKSTVTIHLKEVTWQTALENILTTNALTYKTDGNIIRVLTLDTLKKEQETLPLETAILTPNFAKSADLQQSMAKIISSRGNLQINVSTNSLIVTDTPDIVAKIKEIVETLDVPTPQVMIEAMIISVKLTDASEYGLNFTLTHKERSERKITQSLLPTSAYDLMDLYYGKTILPLYNLSAQLRLWAEDKRIKILASPRVLTLDNLTAQIEITEQVAYKQVSQTTESATVISSTQFKDSGIKLYVTPHITKDKYISLAVKAEQSFVSGFTGDDKQPAIDTRKVETNFMLRDSEAVVIGGLRKRDNTLTVDKIPILGDLPFIGKIFRQETKNYVDSELLIFISPSIVERNALAKNEERHLARSQDELSGIMDKKDASLRNQKILETLDQTAQATAELDKAGPPPEQATETKE